ncbi:MAG: META domain-containing protein [Burkholderiales bacterium]
MSSLRLFRVLGAALLLLAAGCGGAPPAPSLTGTTWVAEDLGGRGVLDRVLTTLTFERDTMAVGTSGCNNYSAPAALDGATLRFGQAAATRRACPPAVMDQEQRFFGVLEETRRYRREGSRLWLLDEQDRPLARFTRVTQVPRS